MDDRAIGVFDSGFGGLTVLKALQDIIPNENYVYVGDSARSPYGPRPKNEVIEFAKELAGYLINAHNVKLLVVACNTSSAVALDHLRQSFKVPVIGVIEPGVKAALKVTETCRVAVIGTVGTIASGSYQSKFAELSREISLTCAACPGFVEFVEKGDVSSEELHILAERLLKPVSDAKVDTLLLGCTHYPFLARTISDVLGPEVVLVSSGEETAFEVEKVLKKLNLYSSNQQPGSVKYYTTGNPDEFAALAKKLAKIEQMRVDVLKR